MAERELNELSNGPGILAEKSKKVKTKPRMQNIRGFGKKKWAILPRQRFLQTLQGSFQQSGPKPYDQGRYLPS